MNCLHCGSAVQTGWKVCPFCEEPLRLTCPRQGCGQTLDPGWVACPACGLLLSQRRQTGAAGPASELPSGHVARANMSDSAIAGGVHPLSGAPSGINASDSAITGGIHQSAGAAAAIGVPSSGHALPGVIPPINVKDSAITGGIHQTITIGGMKYDLIAFPGQAASLFPSFEAHSGSMTLVAKSLGAFTHGPELNQSIRQLRLDQFREGIAKFIGCEAVGGAVYLMREYCLGKPLSAWSQAPADRRPPPLSDREVVMILRMVTRMMLDVPEPHGSLNSNNVFVSPPSRVMIADWGIDILKERVAAYDADMLARLKQYRMGNPYMSVQGQVLPPSKRDAYSLAVMACELMGIDVSKWPSLGDGPSLAVVESRRNPLPRFTGLLEAALTRQVDKVQTCYQRLEDIAYHS